MEKRMLVIVLLFAVTLILVACLVSLSGCSCKQYDFSTVQSFDTLIDKFSDSAIVYKGRTDSAGVEIYKDCLMFQKLLRECRNNILAEPKRMEVY